MPLNQTQVEFTASTASTKLKGGKNMENTTEKCEAKTEVYSRVVGFYRPVEQWNNGKKEEFGERTPYTVNSK